MGLRALVSRSFALVVVLAASGCGDAQSSSSLRVERSDGGDVTRVTGDWSYRSDEVDVDLTLVSEYSPETCVTTARLWVNKVTEAADTYRLEPTDCSVLVLTEEGDIVLREAPTGHDWSQEDLSVDMARERLELGPWTSPSESVTYRFALASPPCANDCECPALTRRAGSEASSLELGRTCE